MNKALKMFFLLGLAFFILIIAGAIGFNFFISFGSKKIERGSILVFDLAGEIPEIRPSDPFAQFFKRNVMTLKEITDSIRYSAIDDRINAVIINLHAPEIGWAKAEEIVSAIKDFKKTTTKPIVSYYEVAENLEYYIASETNEIYSAPTGVLVLNGLRAEIPFFKGLLEKLGIQAELEHIGEYKSASDIFTRDSISDAHKEMVSWLLDGLQNTLLEQVKKNRNIPKEELIKLINYGFFDSKRAEKLNLINGTMYWNDLKDKFLKGERNEKREKIVFAKRYYKDIKDNLRGRGRKIALIYAVGTIVIGGGEDGETIGSDSLTEWINEASNDDSIKAIVMRVDSPGGDGIASDAIWKEVKIAKNKKPLIVSMSDVAGSGGYYISMAANSIVAHNTTLTGSIGVISGKFFINGLFEKLGIHIELIKKADNADLFSMQSHFTEEQKKIIEENLNEFYKVFINKAAEGRKLTPEEIDKVGRGRVWTGKQALNIKLIDMIGGLNDAIELAKKKAKIPAAEKVNLIIYPKRKSFIKALLELDDITATLSSYEDKCYSSIKKILTSFSRTPYLAIMPILVVSR